ncbi:unnamed protein product, partial [Prorocentrum cordatum]
TVSSKRGPNTTGWLGKKRWAEPACPKHAQFVPGWAQLWPLYTASAPASLAFAAWCVWERRRFECGSALHAWTRCFGVFTLLHGVGALAMPGFGCGGDQMAVAKIIIYLSLFASFATVLVQWHLLVLRLRRLGRPSLVCITQTTLWLSAGIVTIFCLVSALLAAFGSFNTAGLMGSSTMPTTDEPDLEQGVHGMMEFVISGFMFFSFFALRACQFVGFCCGACGLLAGAARAALSGRIGAVQAAGWVGMAGVLTLASLFTSHRLFNRMYDTSTADQEYQEALALPSLNLVSPRAAAWSAAWFACAVAWSFDSVLNCLTAALLSGLVGPPRLQRLAEEAFEQINSYSEGQLQAFYLEYLDYLDAAQVQWVKCGYIRRLAAAGDVMKRCQEVPRAEVVVGRQGFPHARGEPKHRYVLSHPWMSKEHPDPEGKKLKMLAQQLDLLGASDSDAIFIDYMGLPQNNKLHPEYAGFEREGGSVPKPGEHPAVRTVEEEKLFKRALGSMELLYSVAKVPVIVLPMDDAFADANFQYISRGWCFFEFSLAFSFGNIANAEIHIPVGQMIKKAAELNLDTVEGFKEGFKSTHFTSKGDDTVVYQLFTQTLNKKPEGQQQHIAAIASTRIQCPHCQAVNEVRAAAGQRIICGQCRGEFSTRIQCPHCQAVNEVRAAAGQRITCGQCRGEFAVPRL